MPSRRSPSQRRKTNRVDQALRVASPGNSSGRSAAVAPGLPEPTSLPLPLLVAEAVFSKFGVADTSVSVAYPVREKCALKSVTFTAKTAASTSSVLTVYVDGVSVGTVTLASGAHVATASLSDLLVDAGSLITVAVTTVGTGLADVTAVVDILRRF